MRAPPEVIAADFDRIARLAPHDAEPPAAVLAKVPVCDSILEVGCGAGALARRLARRAKRVLAIDLSPEMIRVARSHEDGDVEYRVADVMQAELGTHDVVVSVDALHHLPLEDGLARLAGAVRPGGVLIVQDL